MFRLFLAVVFCGPLFFSYSFGETRSRVEDALQILSQLESGKPWLKEARTSLFQLGSVSKTDAVITRYYNVKTGEEQRERQVLIHLKSDQPLRDLVLDMVHELVHATRRSSWDPYDPALTPARYIQLSIEGQGGEVDAVVAECQVAIEMKERFGADASRCEGYLENRVISRDRVVRDFYRVGKWKAELTRELGVEAASLKYLSQETPALYSSTGKAPYPAALLEEFSELSQTACDNSRKRLNAALRNGTPTGSKQGRQIASINQFLDRRCQ